MAKKEQTSKPHLASEPASLAADVQQALDSRASRPWPVSDLMGGVLKILPRMLGLGIPTTAVVNGFAVNGAVLSAEQQAHMNASSKRLFGTAYPSREVVHANGTGLEVSKNRESDARMWICFVQGLYSALARSLLHSQ